MKRKRPGRRIKRIRRKEGGLFPLAVLIPAQITGGKAITAEAVWGAAGYRAKKALEAVSRGKKDEDSVMPTNQYCKKRMTSIFFRFKKKKRI